MHMKINNIQNETIIDRLTIQVFQVSFLPFSSKMVHETMKSHHALKLGCSHPCQARVFLSP